MAALTEYAVAQLSMTTATRTMTSSELPHWMPARRPAKPQVPALALNSRIPDVRFGPAQKASRQRDPWQATHAFALEKLLWSGRVASHLWMVAVAGLVVVPPVQTIVEAITNFCMSTRRKPAKAAAGGWKTARVSSGAMVAVSCGRVLEASRRLGLLQASSACVSWKWSKAELSTGAWILDCDIRSFLNFNSIQHCGSALRNFAAVQAPLRATTQF